MSDEHGGQGEGPSLLIKHPGNVALGKERTTSPVWVGAPSMKNDVVLPVHQ